METKETMETADEIKSASKPSKEGNDAARTTTAASKNKLVIAIAALAVVIAVSAGAIVYTLNGQETDPPAVDSGLTIGYATDASVFLDQSSIQAAMDEALRNARDNYVSLWYQNNAFSEDGVNFTCRIGNSASNLYDMFLTIYADPNMTDQIFLSQLLRPGTGFEKIKLEHALSPGTTMVYVVVSLVHTAEDGTQTIKAQVSHTMDFNVS